MVGNRSERNRSLLRWEKASRRRNFAGEHRNQFDFRACQVDRSRNNKEITDARWFDNIHQGSVPNDDIVN